MKHLVAILLTALMLIGCAPLRVANKALRGFSGTVYRTDACLPVTDVNTNDTVIICNGLVYRVVQEEEGAIYLKVLPIVTRVNDTIIMVDDTSTTEHKTLFKANASELEVYHRSWQQGLAWSTLLLPVKYRAKVDFEGTMLDKVYSTDVSVGPFFGYKFAVGKSYDRFIQIGGFAGPSLIQHSVGLTDSTQTEITNEPSSFLGFTYGYGVVYQVQHLQIGLITGVDQLGGPVSRTWPYDGKQWVSFAVGYNFLGG